MLRKIFAFFVIVSICLSLVPTEAFSASLGQNCSASNPCDSGLWCTEGTDFTQPTCSDCETDNICNASYSLSALTQCECPSDSPGLQAAARSTTVTIDDEDYNVPNYGDKDACLANSDNFMKDMALFAGENLLWGLGFLGVDIVFSLIDSIPIGGLVEPFEDAIGFLRSSWLKALGFGIIASFVNWVAGALISAGIYINLGLTTANPLVTYGGKIILQFANLGFVISLLFIGIATILRLQKDQFSANKLLIKLLVGAALVNLTIPVAGSLVNLGTNLTKNIFDAASPCPGQIARRFNAGTIYKHLKQVVREDPQTSVSEEMVDEVKEKGSSDVHAGIFSGLVNWITDIALVWVTDSLLPSISKLAGKLFLNYITLIVASVISAIAALTFLALAIFLLLRYVILMLLMTFSPLIWFGFIFKGFKLGKMGNIWSAWWSNFLKWTFFGPIIILFIAFASAYLTTVETGVATTAISINNAGEVTGVIVNIAHLLSVIIISGLGLFLTLQFSGVAGNLVMAGVSAGAGFIVGKAQGVLRKGQISAQMRADQLKAQGKTEVGKRFELSAKLLKNAGQSFEIGDKAKSALSQIGVKPQISVPTEKEIREKIIKRRVGETESIGKKAGYALKEKLGFDSTKIDKNPSLVLGLKEDDVKDLSKDGKDSIVSALLKTQKKYAEDSSSLQPKQVIALRKLEKALGSELAQETIKKIPTLEEIEKETNPEEVSKLKAKLRNMLLMANESISDVLKNGTDEMIEKSVETIQALENEYKNNPNSFKQAEVAKLQKIRRDFDKKISDYVVGRLDPLSNPESILDLSNANLTNIAKTGTTIDKKKIDEALLKLVEKAEEKLSSPEKNEAWNRLDAKVNVLKKKGDWV